MEKFIIPVWSRLLGHPLYNSYILVLWFIYHLMIPLVEMKSWGYGSCSHHHLHPSSCWTHPLLEILLFFTILDMILSIDSINFEPPIQISLCHLIGFKQHWNIWLCGSYIYPSPSFLKVRVWFRIIIHQKYLSLAFSRSTALVFIWFVIINQRKYLSLPFHLFCDINLLEFHLYWNSCLIQSLKLLRLSNLKT
jgi:hypothetical protein